jgi:hypothetical protein
MAQVEVALAYLVYKTCGSHDSGYSDISEEHISSVFRNIISKQYIS